MKKLPVMMLAVLLAGSAVAGQTPQVDAQIVAKAKSLAIAKGRNLAEYKQPAVSRLDDGTWIIHFEHVQRYHDKQPVYMVDDCFSVMVDGDTNEATFHPCP
ncbi:MULTISPECIES: hypothetical protein [unclassified Dyella]|uniref:hypothetical protein n=1 Tax=unclassified Dyella TaxID=2634549 RepID=UPI000C85CB1E|nr:MULTISPECIES: hypothetical protein [unclassified Dyella]MDR3443804.1 hypothetical protein [Dyella sp.]PMQ03051.1 hypothetical protein DyAD56_20225 [Dyella sp. AD56]